MSTRLNNSPNLPSCSSHFKIPTWNWLILDLLRPFAILQKSDATVIKLSLSDVALLLLPNLSSSPLTNCYFLLRYTMGWKLVRKIMWRFLFRRRHSRHAAEKFSAKGSTLHYSHYRVCTTQPRIKFGARLFLRTTTVLTQGSTFRFKKKWLKIFILYYYKLTM